MNGIMLLIIGICLGILSVILFIASIIYRQTAGRKIRKNLKRDYE